MLGVGEPSEDLTPTVMACHQASAVRTVQSRALAQEANASANSRAEANRSCGFLARPLSSAASRSADTGFLSRWLGGCGGVREWCMQISMTLFPSNGGEPVSRK